MTASEEGTRPGPRPGPGRLHTPAEERVLYAQVRCAWCETPLATDDLLRETCSERCRRARSRERLRAAHR
jgi:hypothetical protein